jgi:hypothetical protein
MTADDARAELVRLVAPDMPPTLESADVDALLAGARRPDSCGRPPSSADWVPTYDLDAAAAAGWEMKAGRALGFDFGEDGQRFNVSHLHEQCLKMVALYTRGSGSAHVRSGVLEDYVAARREGLTTGGLRTEVIR